MTSVDDVDGQEAHGHDDAHGRQDAQRAVHGDGHAPHLLVLDVLVGRGSVTCREKGETWCDIPTPEHVVNYEIVTKETTDRRTQLLDRNTDR